MVSFDEDTPESLLKILRPDILVKGGDYDINGVVGSDIVYSYGGQVQVLSNIEDQSSSQLIKCILAK